MTIFTKRILDNLSYTMTRASSALVEELNITIMH